MFIVIGIILLAFGLAACGPAQDPELEAATATARAEGVPAAEQEAELEREGEAVSEAAEEAASQEADELQAPESEEFDVYAGLNDSDFQTTESGLQYTVLEQGDGEQAQPGQVVAVHYTGWLEDGSSFDSSIDRGQPFSFALGQGMVIPGWDEGLALLHVGDKARLIIPSELAYGQAGRPGIPPDSTLIFDVELVSISEGAPESPTEVDPADFFATDSGLQYYDLVEGDGPALEEGQTALMHFSVWLDDGTFVDSSLNRGQTISMIVGGGQNIVGWEEGLLNMNVGGMRQMIIPPDLAFGEAGAGGGLIPPNATLVLELEVTEVQDPSQ
ncbi:MAG: FKBP-type peptidyl-prolyl cis-trans isomerase [Chloroflexota bacterium]|nr:MAG: FKBP-type peptidyl-prolyl cis-trans isomerase [Chloroflexota bacterium]